MQESSAKATKRKTTVTSKRAKSLAPKKARSMVQVKIIVYHYLYTERLRGKGSKYPLPQYNVFQLIHLPFLIYQYLLPSRRRPHPLPLSLLHYGVVLRCLLFLFTHTVINDY